MNPTIAQAKAVLGIRTNAEFARFLDLPRQSMTGRGDEDAMPDAWCWRAAKKRPGLFVPPTHEDEAAVAANPEGAAAITKRALLDRLALKTDTGLAVLLGVPRETVEQWADDTPVPPLPAVLALLEKEEPARAAQAEDPDADRIVTLEIA
jgi:hypothetical protein